MLPCHHSVLVCRAIERFKAGKTLQGVLRQGRLKTSEKFDFSGVCTEANMRAFHMDALSFDEICAKIDAVRLAHAKKDDPSVQIVPQLSTKTYNTTFSDLGMKTVDKPATKTARIVAGTDMLNAVNWAAMIVAVLTKANIESEAGLSDLKNFISGKLIFNVDSTSLLLGTLLLELFFRAKRRNVYGSLD